MALEWLLGGNKKTEIAPTANAAPWLRDAQMVQFGADRGRLMRGLEGMYDTSRNQYNAGAQALPGQIDAMGQQLQGISGEVQGNANQLTAMGGYNPYMNYYENPAAIFQQDQAARQAAIDAAYGNYGSLGGQYQQQSGLMAGNAAARGIGNSGYARRMQEDLAARKSAGMLEAKNKGIGESNQYLLNAGQLYNQGRQMAGNQIGQAGQLNLQRGELATKAPQMQLQATSMFGDQANKSGQLWGQGQSEQRNAQQAVNDYNTQSFNKATSDFFQGYNNRNIQQASLDANRQQVGLLPTLMNVAGMATGMFGGRK
jgi:hypothetical protein